MKNEEQIRERIKDLSRIFCNLKYSTATRNLAYKEIKNLKKKLAESEQQ